MQRRAAFLVGVLISTCNFAIAQSTVDGHQSSVLANAPFLGLAPIPKGYSLRLSAAYPPYDKRTDLFYGNISLGLGGLVQATVSHEPTIGTPVGFANPSNLLGLRIQFVPQQGPWPSVSGFLTTMTEFQSESVGGWDAQHGFFYVSYEAKSTLTGVALTSSLNDMIAVSMGLGARQMVWRQGLGIGQVEHRNVQFDISASASYRPIDQLALIGEIASLPFVDINRSSLAAETQHGYVGAIGVRYYLPISLNIDLYDRWYAQNGGPTNSQVRFGLSTDIHFQ